MELIAEGDITSATAFCDYFDCDNISSNFCSHCDRRLCSEHYEVDRLVVSEMTDEIVRRGKHFKKTMTDTRDAIARIVRNSNLSLQKARDNLLQMSEQLQSKKAKLEELMRENALLLEGKTMKLIDDESTLQSMLSQVQVLEVLLDEKSLDSSTVWNKVSYLEEMLEKYKSIPDCLKLTICETNWDIVHETFKGMLWDVSVVNREIAINDSFNSGLETDEDVSLVSSLNGTKLSFTKHTKAAIQSITVSHKTNGYQCHYGRVVKGNKGQQLSAPSIFIKYHGDEHSLHVANSKGQIHARVQLKLADPSRKVSAISCWEAEQKLFLADEQVGCIFIISLSGDLEATIRHPFAFVEEQKFYFMTNQTKLSFSPTYMCVDKSTLYVCHECDVITVHTLPYLQFLETLKHTSLTNISSLSVNPATGELWVCCSSDNIGHVSVFSTDSYRFIKTISADDVLELQDVSIPWRLIHDKVGRAYVSGSYNHQKIGVLELSPEGSFMGFYSGLESTNSSHGDECSVEDVDTANCALEDSDESEVEETSNVGMCILNGQSQRLVIADAWKNLHILNL